MTYQAKNNAFSTLAGALTNVATSLTVQTGHGDRFPVIASPAYTILTLEDASGNREIVKVTARAGASDSMTIVRGQEGTTARAWAAADSVELRMTAGEIQPLFDHVDKAAAAHMAAAIGNTPSGNLSATTVQGALNELQIELDGKELSINAATAKATPADADAIGLIDSAASNALKKVTWANIKATLKTYFDGIYATITNLNLKANIASPTFTGLVTLDDGADIASASTVDLTAATGNTVRITGTTAITAFTMNAGQQMELVAVGALPLTYNATTMNINGGVSYTCAAGDRLKVFKDGSGVVRVNVTKQDGSAVTQSASASSFKNKIIGGDFTTNPWQRGITFAAIADGAYSADRWQFNNTSAGVVSIIKTADAPTATQTGVYSTHCLHVDVTTADSTIAAGDLMAVRQKIEGLNSASLGFGQAGVRYVTLSFWHKHTKTGTHCVALRNSAANRSYVAEYTQSVSDTWELASLTIQVDTSGTWLYDTGVGLDVVFALAAGSTYQTSANTWAAGNFLATSNQVNNLDNTANNFKINLVQLELGQTSTPYETRGVGAELSLCQRYRKQDLLLGFRFPSPVAGATVENRYTIEPMRATPTIIAGTIVSQNSVSSTSTVAVDNRNIIKSITSSAGTNADTYHNQYISLDAEL